jgi:ATP synthase protein I
MPIIAPRPGLHEEEFDAEPHKPLSAEEARALRERDPSVSVWYVLGWQCVVGVVLGLLAWALTGKAAGAWSAAYGALAVVVPAALFARGLLSRVALASPGAAVAGFFVWEVVKIALTLAMLFAAPRLVADLNWPAMLVGLVVTMKVYWVALLVRPKKFKPAS